jgi:hypothetical protein
VRPLDSFPSFYGARRFFTEFTRALHLFLSCARPIQSTSLHPTSPRTILILSTLLRLGHPSGLFPSSFPTSNLYTFLFSPICATYHARLILLDLIILITNDEAPRYAVFSILLSPHQTSVLYLPEHPVLKHPQSMFLS